MVKNSKNWPADQMRLVIIMVIVATCVVLGHPRAALSQSDQTAFHAACASAADLPPELADHLLGITTQQLLSLLPPDRETLCAAVFAWNDVKKLRVLLRSDTTAPEVIRVIAARYVFLDPRASFGWCKLSIAQLKLGRVPEARQSALNAIRNAHEPDAVAGAWLAMASVEDAMSNSRAYETAMQAAFRAKPDLEQEFQDQQRKRTTSNYWPTMRSPQAQSNIFSDHPGLQDRIDVINRLLRSDR